MASTTSITVNCPDCGAPQQMTVHITSNVVENRNELRFTIDDEQFTETFSQHVLADPDKHPSLVIRDDTA